jgi:hypothetical protein
MIGLGLSLSLGARGGGGGAPAPVKSWQIIGQYNDTGFAAQGSNASSVSRLSLVSATFPMWT